MNTTKTFPLSLDFEGKHYEGTIIPAEELGSNGMPVYFRVSINDTFFAYLCCSDTGWGIHHGEERPRGLIQAIGTYIADYYE